MTKNTEVQLSLIELPSPAAPHRAKSARRRMSPEMTVKHCRELLAAIDRSASARDAQAAHVARLYEAAERAYGASSSYERGQVHEQSQARAG